MRKIFACILTVSLISACARKGEVSSDLVIALETSPGRLDPAFVVDVVEGEVCSLIFQGLVRFSPLGEVIPDAAHSWDVLEGGKKYVFHMDGRMHFANGAKVKVEDVVYSFKRVLSPAKVSPRRWILSRIKGADDYSSGRSEEVSGLWIENDSTLVIQLEEPFRPFIMLLASPAAMIVPEEAVEDSDYFSSHPVGSGLWKIQTWSRGDELDLVPNEFNPRASRSIDRIRFRIIPEAFTRIAEFESGELDILRIPPAEVRRFLEDPSCDGRVRELTDLRVAYIGLNNQKKVFKDPRVRRALNMGVDVDGIVNVLLQRQAQRATGAIPPGLGGYASRSGYKYDPERAGELLEEAGLENGFEFELWQRSSPEGDLICEAVQGYLKRVGIRVSIVRREWSAFKEAVSNGKVDAFFLDWFADYPDAENFLFPLFHSSNTGAVGNRSFFKNSYIDSLIEVSQREQDTSRVEALYARIDSLIYDEAPWIFLYFPKSYYVVAGGIEGYTPPVIYLGEDFSKVIKLQ